MLIKIEINNSIFRRVNFMLSQKKEQSKKHCSFSNYKVKRLEKLRSIINYRCSLFKCINCLSIVYS
jgi:hypothetical protein